jgi:hypothetical protein
MAGLDNNLDSVMNNYSKNRANILRTALKRPLQSGFGEVVLGDY